MKTGFARGGETIARLHPFRPGHDGKSVHGTTIPSEKVWNARIHAGNLVRVDRNDFIMESDGKVFLYRYEDGAYFLEGERYRRGKAVVRVSDDEMEAFLTVTPPVGEGREIGEEDVREELKKGGITFGIEESAVTETVRRAVDERIAVEDVLVARGREPEHGRDGELEYRIKIASGDPFTVLEDGSVDFTEHDRYTTVEKGTLIAVLKNPQEGQREGFTVLGESIRPRKGIPLGVRAGNNVEEVVKGEETRFIAKIGGLLHTGREKISVEPLLVVRGDVGPKTGNISFEGSVLVKGSVQDNFSVTARQSVTIKGNVGNGRIRSDENVIVSNGIIGKRGLVVAKGDVSAKFAENTTIRAGKKVIVQRSALNCRIIAGEWIRSGKDKGIFVGGELRAKNGIDVKILGNKSEHRTVVYVGTDYNLQLRLHEVLRMMKENQESFKRILALLNRMKQVAAERGGMPGNLRKSYREAYRKGSAIKTAQERLNGQKTELYRELSEIAESEVIVRDRLFRGVSIHFGQHVFEVHERMSKVKVSHDRSRGKVILEKS